MKVWDDLERKDAANSNDLHLGGPISVHVKNESESKLVECRAGEHTAISLLKLCNLTGRNVIAAKVDGKVSLLTMHLNLIVIEIVALV